MLMPTPPEALVGADGCPYFLWDVPDMSIDEFRQVVRDPDEAVRAYWIGKVMREAKPDDVFLFVTPSEILSIWPALQKHLGRQRAFWEWIFERWRERGVVDG